MHDWTRVPAGIYHDFHNAWITELRNWLNNGQLPIEFYAVGEQRAGNFGPDVLTLRGFDSPPSISQSLPVYNRQEADTQHAMVAVATMPPKVHTTLAFDPDLAFYSSRQRQIAIRHTSGDELIAIIEIVSPANKHSSAEMNRFIDRIKCVLLGGIHAMIIDLFPPGSYDSHGLPHEIAQILGDEHRKLSLEGNRNRSL